MAVPKKRTGHSAQGHRRSNWKAVKPETTKCPNCGETVLAHTVCTACGTYKGKPVRLKDRVEEVVEEKKTKKTKTSKSTSEKSEAKKSTSKKKTEEKVEEVKAEETVVEETSVDEKSETSEE